MIFLLALCFSTTLVELCHSDIDTDSAVRNYLQEYFRKRLNFLRIYSQLTEIDNWQDTKEDNKKDATLIQMPERPRLKWYNSFNTRVLIAFLLPQFEESECLLGQQIHLQRWLVFYKTKPVVHM